MNWQRFSLMVVILISFPWMTQAETPNGSALVLTNEPILRLESLKIGSLTFTNVQVTARTDTDIFIRHRKGIANFKVEDVPREVLEQLGYALNRPQESAAAKTTNLQARVSKGFSSTFAAAQKSQFLMHWVKKVRARIIATKESQSGTNASAGAESGSLAATTEQNAEGAAEQEGETLPEWDQLTATVPQWALILFSVLVVTVPLSYFFFCYTAKLICQKAGARPGALIWLPIVSVFPLLRAARLPGWTALLFLLSPLITLVTQNPWAAIGGGGFVFLFCIVWCFRIVHARGKGILTALCLIFPVTSPVAWLYLAYSK